MCVSQRLASSPGYWNIILNMHLWFRPIKFTLLVSHPSLLNIMPFWGCGLLEHNWQKKEAWLAFRRGRLKGDEKLLNIQVNLYCAALVSSTCTSFELGYVQGALVFCWWTHSWASSPKTPLCSKSGASQTERTSLSFRSVLLVGKGSLTSNLAMVVNALCTTSKEFPTATCG